MSKKLPEKLRNEPIIETVFEMRFEPSVSAVSNILPAILFTKYPDLKLTKLPISDVPQQFKDSDPILRYAPQSSITWQNYTILIGDRVFAISKRAPYEGWSKFKKSILELIEHIKASNVVTKIERYSLKYVNLIENTPKNQLEQIELNLKIGQHQIIKEAINLRVEIPKNHFLHLIQIVSNSKITLDKTQEKEGILINIDTIANNPGDTFWADLSKNLDQIHDSGKSLFFSFLKDKTLEFLEPIYDK